MDVSETSFIVTTLQVSLTVFLSVSSRTNLVGRELHPCTAHALHGTRPHAVAQDLPIQLLGDLRSLRAPCGHGRPDDGGPAPRDSPSLR